MARQPLPPRIKTWRGGLYLFTYDFAKRTTTRECVERLSAAARRKLVQERTARFRDQQAQDLRGYVAQTAYQTPLADSLKAYRKDVEKRVQARRENPKIREGTLAVGSGKVIGRSLDYFEAWLADNGFQRIVTGALSPQHIRDFVADLATKDSKRGTATVLRASETVNKHKRHLRGALGWIDEQRPKQFPDFPVLAKALKRKGGTRKRAVAFTPDQLRKFYKELLRRERDDYTVEVRDKRSQRRGTWQQPARARCTTPLSRVFLMCALSGARLNEVLMLKWEDIDLRRGLITIPERITKTGLGRIVPLTTAPECEIAPVFVDLLRRWKLQAGNAEYVLPTAEPNKKTPDPMPTFNRGGWRSVAESVDIPNLGPQRLRQNFTSFAASMGVPELVCALWQGHSPKVAADFYRAQLLDRRANAKSFEEAMGLVELYDPSQGDMKAG